MSHRTTSLSPAALTPQGAGDASSALRKEPATSPTPLPGPRPRCPVFDARRMQLVSLRVGTRGQSSALSTAPVPAHSSTHLRSGHAQLQLQGRAGRPRPARAAPALIPARSAPAARPPGTEPPRCAWGGVRAEGRLPGRSAGSARAEAGRAARQQRPGLGYTLAPRPAPAIFSVAFPRCWFHGIHLATPAWWETLSPAIPLPSTLLGQFYSWHAAGRKAWLRRNFGNSCHHSTVWLLVAALSIPLSSQTLGHQKQLNLFLWLLARKVRRPVTTGTCLRETSV